MSSPYHCSDFCFASTDIADVSQIVYPFGANGDPDDGVQYMRVQDRRSVPPSRSAHAPILWPNVAAQHTHTKLTPECQAPVLFWFADVYECVCRGSDARVHWWYWPDSYDSWIPADQAPDVDDPDKPARGRSYLLNSCSMCLSQPDLICSW